MTTMAVFGRKKMTDKICEEILHDIQIELKAPKGQTNTFGKFNYRSCEDILAAVKNVLPKGCFLGLGDELVLVGDRYYIKATASLHAPSGKVETCAYAREAEFKKGMDESQVTGTASSYARKYALSALFAIDNTKDADTNEYQEQTKIFNTRKARNELVAELKKAASNCKDVADMDNLYIDRKQDFDNIKADGINAGEEIVYDDLIKEFKGTKAALKSMEKE